MRSWVRIQPVDHWHETTPGTNREFNWRGQRNFLYCVTHMWRNLFFDNLKKHWDTFYNLFFWKIFFLNIATGSRLPATSIFELTSHTYLSFLASTFHVYHLFFIPFTSLWQHLSNTSGNTNIQTRLLPLSIRWAVNCLLVQRIRNHRILFVKIRWQILVPL